MNEYDETLDYPLSFHVEALFGKPDLDDHDVNYLTRTEMQYAPVLTLIILHPVFTGVPGHPKKSFSFKRRRQTFPQLSL